MILTAIFSVTTLILCLTVSAILIGFSWDVMSGSKGDYLHIVLGLFTFLIGSCCIPLGLIISIAIYEAGVR